MFQLVPVAPSSDFIRISFYVLTFGFFGCVHTCWTLVSCLNLRMRLVKYFKDFFNLTLLGFEPRSLVMRVQCADH